MGMGGPSSATSSSDRRQPRYTSESATSILASFGLSNEDLELLSHYPDDQLTPDNLPFILRDIRIRKSKRSSSLDVDHRPQAAGRGVGAGGGSDHLAGGGPADSMKSKVIDYGHASKYGGYPEDAGGGDGGGSGGPGDSYGRSGRDPLPEDAAGKYGAQHQHMGGVGGSPYSGMMTNQDLGKRSQQQQHQKQQKQQQQRQQQSPISLPKKDMDDRLLDPKAPKPIPVRDPGTNRLPATPNRAVAPGQAPARSDLVVLSGGGAVGPGVGAGKGSGVGAPVGGVSAGVLNPVPVPAWPPAFPLMDMSVPLPPMLHVPVTIPSPPVGHHPHPHPHHPMGPAAAVAAMMQMPPVHPMSRPPPAVVPPATLLPTPSMMSDYSATTPRIFPHTCSLCNVECYQIKNWIEHQNSSHHIESCRHLRQQFPNWNVETLSVPSRNEASPYQERFQRRQDSHSASRSQSWSRSPSPRRGYHSSGPSSYRRAHSRSRSKSPRRHVRRSRSKSRSPRRQMRASPSSSSSHRRRSPQGRRSRSRSRERERDREWRTALQRSGRSAANPGKKHRSSSAEKLAKKLLKTSSGLSLTKGTSLEAMMQSLAPALLAELAKKRGTTNAPATSSCKGNGRKLSSSQKTASLSSKSTATKAATASATKAASATTKAATASATTKAATASATTKAATASATTKAATASATKAATATTKAATASATKAASATTKAATASATKAAAATKAAMSSKVKVSKTSSPPPPSSSPSTSSSSCQVKKTSAPGRDCLLWLKGVPAHTTHEDVVKAVQPFGNTNMVILLKAIHEASVLMENEEDAQALANCKDFTIRGMPVTIVMEKDTQLQDGKTEQKEQMPADRKATTTKTQSSTTKSTSSKTSLRTATKTSLTATKPQTTTTKTTPKGSTSTPKAQTATAKAQTTTPSNTPTDAAAAPKAAPTDAKPEVPSPVKDRTWKFVSMTGLPESGYKEEDVLRLARPFNYRHGSQNSFILPLQRRALFRMRGVQNAVAMVKAYTDNPPTLLDCKLSVEQVTLPLSLSKCQTFQMLMDLSNMRCDEPEMLRERLLIVTNIPPGLDGMEKVLQVVRGRGLIRRFIPLINKIYFEMEDGEVAARVYNHYQNFPCHIHNWTMRFSIFNAKPKPVKNSPPPPPAASTTATPAKRVATVDTVTAAGSTSAPRHAAATPQDQRPGSDGIIVIDSDSDEPMEEEVDEEDEEDEGEPCQEECGTSSPVKEAGDETERGSGGVKAAEGDEATGAMKMERGEGRREKKEGEATAAEENNNNNGDSIVTAVTVTAPEVAAATSSSAPTAEVGTEVKRGHWIADTTAATAAVPGRAAESLVTADDQSQAAANSSETQPPAPGNGASAPSPSGPADVASAEPDGPALPVGVMLPVNPEEKPLDFPPVTREILKALEAAVHQHRMERRAEEQTKQNQAKPDQDQDQNQDQDQGEAAPPTHGRGAQPDKKSPPAGEKKAPAAVKNQSQPEKKSHTPAAEKRTPSQAEKNTLDKKSPAKQDKKTHPERSQTSDKKTLTTPAKKPSPQGADSSRKAQSDQKTQGSAGRGRRGDHSSPERKDLSRLRSSRAPSEEEQPPTSRRGNSSSSSSGSRRGKQDGSPVAKRRRREEEQRKSHSSSRPSRSESHKTHAPERKGSSYTADEITSDPVPDLDEFDLDEFNLDEFVTVDEVGEEAESTSLPQDSSSSSSSSTPKKTEPQRSSKRKKSQETPAPKGSQEPSTKTSSHKPTTTLSFTPVSDPPAQKKPAPSQKPQKKNAPSAKAAVAAKKTQPAKPAAASGRKTRSSAASSSVTAREVMENNNNTVEEPKNPQPIGEAAGKQQQEEEVPETVKADDDVEGAVARAGQQVSPADTAVAGETEESAVSEAAVMEAADTLAAPPEAEEVKDQADLASSVLEKGAQNGACPPPVEASLTDDSVLEEKHQEPLKASGKSEVGYQAPGGESFQIPDSVDGRVATEDGGKTPKEACLGRQVPESQDEPMSQEEKPTYQVVGSVDDQQPTQEEGSQVQKEDGVADQVREEKSHQILHSVDNLITTEEEEKGNQVPEKEGGKNPGESYKILDSVDDQTTTEEEGNRTSVKQAPNDGESDFQILDSLDAQTTTEEEQGNQMHKEEDSEFQVLDSLDDQPAKEGEPGHQMTQTPTAETEGSVDPPQSPKKGALVTLDEVSEEEEDYPDDATEEEELMKKQALAKEKEKAREREKERERRRSKEREISRERSKEKERGRKREEKKSRGKERVGADTEGLVTLDEVGGDEPVEGDEGLEEADLQALVTLDEIVDEEGGEDESGDAFNPELLVTLDEAVGDEEEEMEEEQSKLSAAAPDPQQTDSTGEPAGSPGPEEEGKDLEEIRKMNFVTVDEVGEEEEEEEEQVVTTRRGARAKKRARQTPVRKSNRGKRGGVKVNEQEEEEEEEEEKEEEPPAHTAPPFKEPALNPPSSLVKDSEAPESGSQPPASSPELKEKEADVAAERPSAEALSSGQEPHQEPPETQSLEQERTVSCDDKADRRAALKDDSKNRREEADPEAKRCRSQSPMITGFKLPPFSPDNPIGVDFVVPKTGFFCKLCSLFYGSEDSAKKNHCSSLRHYQNMEKYYQKLQKQPAGCPNQPSSQGSTSE